MKAASVRRMVVGSHARMMVATPHSQSVMVGEAGALGAYKGMNLSKATQHGIGHKRAVQSAVLILLVFFSFLRQQHARKGLALPQAWNAGDVSPPGRSRRSDTLVAAPVLFAHARSLIS